MNFTYTAINANGARVQERVEADSDDQALRRLQAQGYVVLSLQAARGQGARVGSSHGGDARRGISFSFGARRRVKLEQIAILSREFAIMIETGVPVTEALEAMCEHADSPAIRDALTAAHHDLSEGKTISQALSGQKHVFPSIYVSMVRTAETGGSLDTTLNQAADYLEAALEMRRKVSGALTYPAVLLFVAAAVLIFMMTYLLPQFKPLFERMGAQIPPSTRFLLATSAFLKTQWWTIPVTFVGGIVGMRAVLRHPVGRDMFTRLVHRIPVVGDVVKKVALARLLRSLGTLTGTGVSLLLAIDTATQTAQNSVFERALTGMRVKIEEGMSIADAVADAGVFPPIVCQMMTVGEKSGRLSDVLQRIAKFYERDVDARLKMLTSIIEPVMIVLLGLMVGFIAVSIIAPIYSMVGSVK